MQQESYPGFFKNDFFDSQYVKKKYDSAKSSQYQKYQRTVLDDNILAQKSPQSLPKKLQFNRRDIDYDQNRQFVQFQPKQTRSSSILTPPVDNQSYIGMRKNYMAYSQSMPQNYKDQLPPYERQKVLQQRQQQQQQELLLQEKQQQEYLKQEELLIKKQRQNSQLQRKIEHQIESGSSQSYINKLQNQQQQVQQQSQELQKQVRSQQHEIQVSLKQQQQQQSLKERGLRQNLFNNQNGQPLTEISSQNESQVSVFNENQFRKKLQFDYKEIDTEINQQRQRNQADIQKDVLPQKSFIKKSRSRQSKQ